MVVHSVLHDSSILVIVLFLGVRLAVPCWLMNSPVSDAALSKCKTPDALPAFAAMWRLASSDVGTPKGGFLRLGTPRNGWSLHVYMIFIICIDYKYLYLSDSYSIEAPYGCLSDHCPKFANSAARDV